MVAQTFDPTAGPSQAGKRRRMAPSPRAPQPRAWARPVAVAAAAAGMVTSVGLAISSETGRVFSLPGGPATFVGTLTGMAGTYLALLMILLISRIPLMERVLGQDGLLRWHRRVAPWPISLLMAHALFIVIGYAQAAKTGFFHEVDVLVLQMPNLLGATVGLGLMVLAGTVSIRAIRCRLKRETWWIIHLYMYMALALSFAHVILLGPSFVGHPLTRIVWSVVWAATAGLVIVYRLAVPLARSMRYRLRVQEVRQEGPGVVSVVCRGRRLDQLAVSGGQFLVWRFIAPGLWWQAHPYSLSARPRPPYVRLTVKQVGDHSKAVSQLRPGTRVFIEGPFGAFTADARRQTKAVLVAGGIGITALRALLEDLPRDADPCVIVRASTEEDLALRHELAELVRQRKGTLHEVIGSRHEVPLDADFFWRLVPDVAQRDVFVCGPPLFVRQAVDAIRETGVPRESIHFEEYSW